MNMICDRCKKQFDGEKTPTATCGYYERGGSFTRFFDVGENILCDNCMFADGRYILEQGMRLPNGIFPAKFTAAKLRQEWVEASHADAMAGECLKWSQAVLEFLCAVEEGRIV